MTPGLAPGPWHPRRACCDESLADRSRQPNAFLLSWAEGALRKALSPSPRLDTRPYEIFGQGSRVNNTYLERASDIDLVLMLKVPFESNIDALDKASIDKFQEQHPAADYNWQQFREDVLAALGESYVVRVGRRCLNVDDTNSLFGEMVDILVAAEYRLYSPFSVPGAERYEQGVFFRDHEGQPIVNFPKQHRRNGEGKDLRTGGQFKKVVRTAKRVRRLAEQEQMIAKGTAPSYLLECLLYNVPDYVYRTSSPSDAYRDAIEWLRRCNREDPVSFAELPCQNGINRLFGTNPDQWEAFKTGRIIGRLQEILKSRTVAAA
jgi:hypothetical protein